MTTAIALSGGGANGDFEVGVLRFLYDIGVRPDILSTTSVGSVNGLKLAEGEGAADQGLEGLEKIWLGLMRNDDMYQREAWTMEELANELLYPVLQSFAETPKRTFPALADSVHYQTLVSQMVPLGPVEGGSFGIYVSLPPTVSALAMTIGLLGPISLIGIGITADKAAALLNHQSIYNLEPIRQKASASLVPARVTAWAATGNRLRMAMVGLASGELRYVTETGRMVERDGFTPCYDQETGFEIANVSLIQAMLASAAIPVFFRAITIKDDLYVDAGIREQLPIDVAAQLGARTIYAVHASKRDLDPRPDVRDGGMVDIAMRSLMEIAINEIAYSDTFRFGDWAPIDVKVIQPRIDIHETYTIYPAFVRIRMAYGFMCAEDSLQPRPDTWRAKQIADEITALRYGISRLEAWYHGRSIPPDLQVHSTPPAAGLIDEIRRLKMRVKVLIDERLNTGASMPPREREWSDPLRWWAEWERHPWTPNVAPLEWPSMSPTGIGDHMYTTYYAEQADAVARNGYRSEGIAARVLPASQPRSGVPLFQLLNAGGDHFYTVSEPERDNAIANFGYSDQGIACYVYPPASSDLVPLYRQYFGGNGDHFYTTDLAERDLAIANIGYQAEGIACLVETAAAAARFPSPNIVPLYRLSHPSGDHFYTTDAVERQNAITAIGYVDEGITGYVRRDQTGDTVPLFRLFNATNHDHFYTTSEPERDSATGVGYAFERIQCYVWRPWSAAGRAPFYRLLNGSGDHFYTASLEERDNAIRAVGYHSEGVACDVPTAQAPITVALWRLLKTN
jgi:predicted acylesterase/phospholipase RssA